jgi:hypothetical protein
MSSHKIPWHKDKGVQRNVSCRLKERYVTHNVLVRRLRASARFWTMRAMETQAVRRQQELLTVLAHCWTQTVQIVSLPTQSIRTYDGDGCLRRINYYWSSSHNVKLTINATQRLKAVIVKLSHIHFITSVSALLKHALNSLVTASNNKQGNSWALNSGGGGGGKKQWFSLGHYPQFLPGGTDEALGRPCEQPVSGLRSEEGTWWIPSNIPYDGCSLNTNSQCANIRNAPCDTMKLPNCSGIHPHEYLTVATVLKYQSCSNTLPIHR